jgi:preprotein translocase subunit SecD
MKTTCLLVSACLFSIMSFAGQGPEVFQVRLAAPAIPDASPRPNSERMVLEHAKVGGGTYREVFDVDRTVLLDRKDIKVAQVVLKPDTGKPVIGVTFTAEGGKRFAEVTRQNIDKRLAIILSGRVLSVPVIRTEIPGGKAEISGSFSQKEAEALCQQINGARKN